MRFAVVFAVLRAMARTCTIGSRLPEHWLFSYLARVLKAPRRFVRYAANEQGGHVAHEAGITQPEIPTHCCKFLQETHRNVAVGCVGVHAVTRRRNCVFRDLAGLRAILHECKAGRVSATHIEPILSSCAPMDMRYSSAVETATTFSWNSLGSVCAGFLAPYGPRYRLSSRARLHIEQQQALTNRHARLHQDT